MKQVKTQKSHERMESALKSIQEIQNKQKKICRNRKSLDDNSLTKNENKIKSPSYLPSRYGSLTKFLNSKLKKRIVLSSSQNKKPTQKVTITHCNELLSKIGVFFRFFK